MKFIVLISLFLISVSCNSSKKTTAENPKPDEPNIVAIPSEEQHAMGTNHDEISEQVSAAQIKKNLPDTLRLVVSMISIGEGTDQEAPALLEAALERFFNSTGKKPVFAKIPWGREGEKDYYFSLKELNPDLQSKLIEDLRVTFKEHALVKIVENMENHYRR